ncbi:hypothetical protein GCM10025868_46660 [Angustibacter aerolatus]|uniref:Amidase domain-containing protein n=1 Tax=Angustibacter aerolatus TaxID=1162965 RepID=A0ABQ6JPB7_9ACTN|nr:hypothetical protein GCM10025868_46660 [Angustibacter aerolatus]
MLDRENALEIGDDDLPLAQGRESTAPALMQTAAAKAPAPVDRLKAVQWAWDHVEDKPKYDNNCQNFVSKALRGGDMKFSEGGRNSTHHWWKHGPVESLYVYQRR